MILLIYEKLHQDIRKIKFSANVNYAIYNHIDNQIDFFEKNKLLSKLISEYKKYLISIKIAELLKDSSASFTKTRLQFFTSDKQLATPNRTSAIIDTAVHLGFLTSKPSVTDRRHNSLAATEKFYKIKNDQININKKSLNLIFPSIKIESNTNNSSIPEKFLEIYFGSSLCFKNNSAINIFLKREAGYPILLKILQTARHCHHKQAIALSFSQLSRNFGVSRAHVQKMFQAAHDAKLIRLQAPGGKEIEIMPLLERLSRNMIILSLAIAKGAIDCTYTQNIYNNQEFETAILTDHNTILDTENVSTTML